MTTAVRPVTTTHTIRMDVVQGASLVGQIVTRNDQMYRVHCVEGPDWYAFAQDGQVTIDQDMTPVSWITTPVATLLPMGSKVGDGDSVTEMLPLVRRGVSLVKSGV